MFKASKTPITCIDLESKTRYDSPIVVNQLSQDFFHKCYICGSKIETDFRVEHFVPHLEDESKKYDWNNLFLACDYCNNIKSSTFNNNGKNIIDSTQLDPVLFIEHKIDYPDSHIQFSIINNTIESINSIELLKKIYISKENETAAYVIKREALIKGLRRSLNQLTNLLYEIIEENMETEHYRYLKYKISSELHISNQFYEFKRTFILNNELFSIFVIEKLGISLA